MFSLHYSIENISLSKIHVIIACQSEQSVKPAFPKLTHLLLCSGCLHLLSNPILKPSPPVSWSFWRVLY